MVVIGTPAEVQVTWLSCDSSGAKVAEDDPVTPTVSVAAEAGRSISTQLIVPLGRETGAVPLMLPPHVKVVPCEASH